jgi:cytochrome c-type biogenesis protein CcmH
MTSSGADWTPALAALGLGAILGIALLWRLRTARPGEQDLATQRATRSDLAVRRDALIARLRDLDEEAPNQPPEALAQERQRLELEAARVLMELDLGATTPQPRLPRVQAPTGGVATGSTLRGFLWGAGSAAALALLFYVASRSGIDASTEGAETGARPGDEAGATSDARIAELRAQIEKDPDNLDARVELARHSLAVNDMMAVFGETRFVLDRKPDEPRALTYQAVVRLAMGQPKKAEEMLERAIAAKPDLEDAYVYLMLVHTETGNAPAADTVLKRATARLPSEADELRSVLVRMRSETSASGGARRELPENPHAALEREGSPESAAHAGSASTEQGVSGTVDLAAQVTLTASPRAAVYVSVRRAGQSAGPPLAVKKLPATAFPLAFEVGAADSMTGAALPGELRIEARLAADGDAARRAPGEPRAVADGVLLGTRDIRLMLAPSR